MAIVTGASKGIGGGIATALTAAGARVAVNYSSDWEGAERVARAIIDRGDKTIAAWTFGGEGKRVAVVDRKYMGGSCPNIACLPSKNIIHSAKVASYFRRSREFGIAHDGFTIDMSGVREHKRKMVTGLNETYLENYKKTGAEFMLGTGRFIAPRTVEATLPNGTTRQLRGENVIVSTGTRTAFARAASYRTGHD